MDLLNFLREKKVALELTELLVELADAVRQISVAISDTSTEKTEDYNAFGEQQLALDQKAEECFSDRLKTCPFVALYGSEELPALMPAQADGKYTVVYDPLDGSSLVDVNFSVGSIVGIYEGATLLGRRGREQIAALYAVYGPRTLLVLSTGEGVYEFILRKGEWHLNGELKITEEDLSTFAPGNLRAASERVDYKQLLLKWIDQKVTLRYSGGMVPDVHHILRKGGGIFMYPGMPSSPSGKLRLIFEAAPMAYLVEKAGGVSSEGKISLLEVPLEDPLQRTPVFLGSSNAVQTALHELVS